MSLVRDRLVNRLLIGLVAFGVAATGGLMAYARYEQEHARSIGERPILRVQHTPTPGEGGAVDEDAITENL